MRYFYFAIFDLLSQKKQHRHHLIQKTKVKVHQGIENFETIDYAVVTTGTFDGVHIGHRKILERLCQLAKKHHGESVLLTFYPHPRMVLQPDSELKLINTIEEKVELIESVGIDHLIIHPFTKAFSRTTSMEFVRDLLVNKIGTKKLVIGYDHHFGRNREGSFEHLKEFGPLYGFDVEEISAQEIDDVNVSSTKIRKAIQSGDLDIANEFLSRPFSISGEVIKGNQIGRQLGFPTANLKVNDQYKLLPKSGVYAVKALLQNRIVRDGMMNIGYRPTIDESSVDLKIEVHLFNFNQDLYGQNLQIEVLHRLRDEQKFDSLDSLKEAVAKDAVEAKKILS